MQRRVHVLRHAGGIAAYVHTCSILQPAPEHRPMLDHPVLYINLVFLVAREGGVESRQMSISTHCLKLFAIEVIGFCTALAKEQPIAALGADRAALMQEAAKWRYACARADHDDRYVWLRKAEFLVRLNVNWQTVGDGCAIGKESGTNTAALAIV